MLSALSTIARTEGAGGLFRGLGLTILTNAPYSAFYYLFYTSLQERMKQVCPRLLRSETQT
jgi:solute carrier family 25 protein 38